MRIYDVIIFKSLSRERFWAHRFYFKGYSNTWSYITIDIPNANKPRIFESIKRVV